MALRTRAISSKYSSPKPGAEIHTRGKHLQHPLQPQDGRWETSLPPPANPADHLFPRNTFHISTIDLIKTMIEFGPLGWRKRHSSRIDRKAIPEPFEEYESLLRREIINVEGWFRHTNIMSFAVCEGKTP